jgi:5S rRNA maturation endonuclease (ribonuclease M5)
MKLNQAIVNQITDECCEVIGEMLTELGIPYSRSQRRLFGPCPIHGGDNPGAWNLYPEGDNVRGIWFCRTHNCHEEWKKTLVGFVHAILCRDNPADDLTWIDAVKWMARFLGYDDFKDVKTPDAATLERQRFNNMTRRLNLAPRRPVKLLTSERYQKAVKIPAPYYIDRGYDAKTLERYEVGYAKKTHRVVVPIYNEDHESIVGMTARSMWDQCEKCSYYHNPLRDCPVDIGAQINACKWKNSPGFEAAHYLYNLWFARPYIINSKTIILVEGPGDVWRLEEAGIKNSVAMFGTDLTEEQLTLIESSWAMNVVVLTDNDEAGKKAAENVKKKLQRTHRLFFPGIKADDVGALQTDQVTDDIAPILEQIDTFNKQVGV